MNIYLSLEVIYHSSLAKEPVQLTSIRACIKYLKYVVSCFEKLVTQGTEMIDLTSRESSRRSLLEKHCRKPSRLPKLHSVQTPYMINCIYEEQEYLENTRKERKTTCKKPKLVDQYQQTLCH